MRGEGRRSRVPVLGVALAAVAGCMLASQSLLLGHLATDLRSPWLAASVANLGLVGLGVAVGLGTGGLMRGWRRWHSSRPPRWTGLHGVFAAGMVLGTAYGVPIIGVAMLSAVVVAGQVTGGMVIDTVGAGVRGRVPVTPSRVAGVLAALGSVSLTAQGASGGDAIVAVTAAAAAGLGFAVYQAGMGHHQRASGEPIFGAVLGFATASVPLAMVAILTRDAASVSAGWELSAGDVAIVPLGLGVGLLVSRASTMLGVVQLTLAMVLGQVGSGLMLDWITGGHVDTSARAVVALALMLAGVLLVSRTSQGRRT